MAAQYHEFSDWYAQFNHALNPKSRPPFPRMMLNEAIERHQGVAKEVHLVATSSPKDAPVKIASRHQLAMQLDSADMNRVARSPRVPAELPQHFVERIPAGEVENEIGMSKSETNQIRKLRGPKPRVLAFLPLDFQFVSDFVL